MAVVPIFTLAPTQGLALRERLETCMTYTEIPAIIIAKKKKKGRRWGFPGGSVVKNLPASAEGTGSIPDPGRSPASQSNKARAPQPLSPRTETTEAHVPSSPGSETREASAMSSPRIGPHSPQLEKNLCNNEDPA